MSSREIAIAARGVSKAYTIMQQDKHRVPLAHAVALRLRHPLRRMPRETIWALRTVSFDIYQGEVVGLIGRNGAGKSTLLKLLSRITEPTAGQIGVWGRVGSLLEVGTGFHPQLTGRENIYLNGAILGMRRSEIKSQFDGIVAFSGVEKFLDTPVKRYSSGMHVRLAFAVAVHLRPEILIVDEVLAVGDGDFQRRCMAKMDEVARSGRTSAPNESIFMMPKRGHTAKMIKRDLDAARQKWINEAPSDEERRKREKSDFLRYKDSDGRYVDFHALRHTRGVWLFKHHKAEGRHVQDLLGLGSLALVDRYSRSYSPEHGDVVKRGPELPVLPGAKVPKVAVLPAKSVVSTEPKVPSSLYRSLHQDPEISRISTVEDGQSARRTSANSDGQKQPKNLVNTGVLTQAAKSAIVVSPLGEVAERLNAPVSKTGNGESHSGVRISPSPLTRPPVIHKGMNRRQ